MKAPNIVMEMRGLTAFYNGTPVLLDLNCEFEGNKITSIIGPSGSGKSTLLKTLCRMNDRVEGFALQGEVRVFGQDIYAKPNTRQSPKKR